MTPNSAVIRDNKGRVWACPGASLSEVAATVALWDGLGPLGGIPCKVIAFDPWRVLRMEPTDDAGAIRERFCDLAPRATPSRHQRLAAAQDLALELATRR